MFAGDSSTTNGIGVGVNAFWADFLNTNRMKLS